jgi:hypothetical protein
VISSTVNKMRIPALSDDADRSQIRCGSTKW